MADFTAAVGALRARLEANFAALPIYWPNDPREPNVNGFVYCEAYLVDENAVSLGFDGERRHRDLGELVVNVYVPAGTLIGAAESYANTIRNLFSPNSVADVQITSRRIGRGQRVSGGSGGWYAVPVIVEWFSDRIE